MIKTHAAEFHLNMYSSKRRDRLHNTDNACPERFRIHFWFRGR